MTANDVVRHVILRILVDQAGLAESLAEARAKLKALEDSERESNKNRASSAGSVTKAYEDQAGALERNRKAIQDHEAASRRDATTHQQGIRDTIKQVDESTRQELRSVEQIEQARQGEHQRELARFNAEQKAQRSMLESRAKAGDEAAAAERKSIQAAENARLESMAKVGREQQKLNQDLAAKQFVINDAEMIGSATRPARREALLHEVQAASDRVRSETESTRHVTETRRQESLQATSATSASVEQAAANLADRRAQSLQRARTAAGDLKRIQAETSVLEQRALSISEQRVASARRLGTEVDKNNKGIKAFLTNFAATAEAAVIVGSRSVLTAPRSAAQGARTARQDFDRRPSFGDPLKDVVRDASTGERIIARFFKAFGSGADDAMRKVVSLKGGLRAFFADINRNFLGGGSGAGGQVLQNLIGLADSVNIKFGDIGKHFASLESIILAIVAAFGPLAAMLGAVGAAALGLASNLAALSGVLFALPGVITSLVAGFGALAIVMHPLANVFSAFTAAQKEQVTNSRAAASAALDYKDAVLQQQEALIAYNRAQQDGPRLQLALNDARKQATRDIEDYRTALKKLRYDEEGATEGVLSAQQQARRAMADPTANNLDRRIALHNVQGALFDQQDQATQAKRTRQDAAEAFGKGVEGSDAVVAAERAVEDQTYKVQEAYIAWQKAIIAVNKAALEKAAGGTAAATFRAEIAKLPPETRKVAQAIFDLIGQGGPFQKMRNRLSENVFGKLSGDTGKFRDVLAELSDFLTPASSALGDLADAALKLFTSPSWKSFISQEGKTAGSLFQLMGQAALAVADGFKGIVTAAAPFTNWLVTALGGVAKDFDKWANSPKGQNGIIKFLETTEERIKQLWPIVKNFAAGFAGFFTALNTPDGGKKDFTSKINDGLLGISKTFRKLGDEAAQPNSGFRKWLREVGPLLKQVVGFIGAAGSFFGKLFSDPRNIDEAKNILKELATKWLPRLAEIFGQISSSGLISKIAEGIGAVFGAIETFLKNGGADSLKIVADDIGRAGDLLAKFITVFSSMPGLIKVVGETIAFVFGAALVARFSGLTAILKGVFGLFQKINGIAANVRQVNYQDEDSPRRKGTGGKPTSDEARNTTRPGGVGSTRAVEQKPSVFSRFRNWADRSTRVDPELAPGASTRPARGVRGTAARISTTARNEIIGTVTGRNTGTNQLSRIEDYARRIEINTRRWRSGASGATTGGPEEPTRPTGGGNGPRPTQTDEPRNVPTGARPTETGEQRPTSTVRDRRSPYGGTVSIGQSGAGSVRSRIDSRGGIGAAGTPIRGTGTGGQTATRRQTTTTPTYSPERQAQNERRQKVGLKPLPPDGGGKPLEQKTSDPTRPGDPLGADPNGYTVPTTPGGDRDKEDRYRQVENSRRLRQGMPALDPSEPAPRPTPPVDRNLPYQQQTRRNEVARQRQNRLGGIGGVIPFTDEPTATARRTRQDSSQREIDDAQIGQRQDAVADRRATRLNTGRGVVPRLDYQEPTPAAKPESRRQQRQRRAQLRQQQFGTRLGQDRDSGSPLTDVGRDLSPYGIDPDEEFRDGSTRQPVRDPRTGRFISRDPARRADTTDPQPRTKGGRFGSNKPAPVDVTEEPETTARPSGGNRTSRRQRILDNLRGDAGSVGLGIGTREDEVSSPRRTRSIRSARPTRARGRGKGLLGGVLGGLGSLVGAGRGPAADEFDEGYNDGYNDALSQLGGGLPERDRAGEKGGRRGRTTAVQETEEPSRGRAASRGATAVEDEVEQVAEGGRGRGRGLSRLFSRGARSTAVNVAEEGVEGVVRGGAGRTLGRVGLGLARGAVGGIGGLVAGAAATLGGDYLINKYVKNDKDAGSLQRGLGAVAQGAGLGATIGSIVPGVGTVVGGAVGGLVGGAYSLIKDKNLRNFVGGKISSGAKAVGGFVSGAAGKVGGFVKGLFGGGEDDADGQKSSGGVGSTLAKVAGPIGALVGKTDIGKSIIDSLNKAGGKIGSFFTKTIPDAFHKGVQGIISFFTKTLPSLPGKFFDLFFIGIGRMIRFFYHDLPAAAIWLFTKAIPNAAKAAWGFVVDYLWNPFIHFIEAIPGFFTQTIPRWFETVEKWREEHIAKPLRNFITKTIPDFFTVTIPKWFAEAPHWFKTHVIDNVTNFFTKTIPSFFTVTLPDAIKALPGILYDHLVQPILDFFKGLAGHVGDFLKGSWDWVKGLFNRAGRDVKQGEQGKMSGGLITGVYQGVEDTVRLRATPDEFVMRRSKVMEPGAKAILSDWNEGRINVSDFYKGLSANTAPSVMAMVPPEASQLTNRVATVVNHTTHQAPVMGDVTINNPIRERSEATLRRQIHIAAIRHRR